MSNSKVSYFVSRRLIFAIVAFVKDLLFDRIEIILYLIERQSK